ncbi:formyl transferase [Leptospira interrogans]|uniref:formyl transferase n=1 Tax=Leptospira interrogans TaxID=173 RepID=UPI00077313CB|nr:formyl transferase [Leptospira interrogans]KAA1288386.1 formyl transferase [Leptospira interrogans serovar Geyaweera]MCR8637999.1 formyl transferase [Leptospira interrogans serovar Ricardi]
MNLILLTTFESPWGLEMIRELLKKKILPMCIICSRKLDRDEKHRKIVEERTGGKYKFPIVTEVLDGEPIPFYFVKSHNDITSEKILKKYNPDYIILGGADIIKENILSIPLKGTVNIHPGLMPMYRGCSNVEWALYNDDHVGTTCHFVNAEIDSGDVIYQERLRIEKGDTYEQIRANMFAHGAEVLVTALERLEKGLRPIASTEVGDYYQTIENDKIEFVKRKLIEKTYKKYDV